MRRKLLLLAIASCLVGLCSVPLVFMAFASAGPMLGGVVFLAIPALLQIPVYLLLHRSGVLPKVNRHIDG